MAKNWIAGAINKPGFPIKNEEGKYVPNLDENGNWVTRVLHDGQ
jgi:hypothetical protein